VSPSRRHCTRTTPSGGAEEEAWGWGGGVENEANLLGLDREAESFGPLEGGGEEGAGFVAVLGLVGEEEGEGRAGLADLLPPDHSRMGWKPRRMVGAGSLE
jgi:hypothetical protein